MHSAAAALAISLFFFQILLLLLPAVASAVPDGRCPTKCGDVEIPYPFGIGAKCFREGQDYICKSTETDIGANCSLGRGFNLTCNTMKSGLKKPFSGNVEVLNISLTMGQVRMLNHISSSCFLSNQPVTHAEWTLNMGSPYRFSDLHNKFTVIGCHTLAYILDLQGDYNNYQSGCVSMCQNETSLTDESCSGIGCCQTSIPKNLQYYKVRFDEAYRNPGNWGFGECSYAVLLEAKSFKFNKSYITNRLMQINNDGRVPVVMDWAIGNETCGVAIHNLTSYACISNNSACIDSSNGPGYLCNCSKGYQGNPYVSNGCQDIDDCNLQPNPCSDGANCQNVPGNYSCHCPEGTHGDPYHGACIPNQKLSLAVKAVIGTSISLTFLLVFGMCICMIYQRRRLIQSRKRYFSEHGGMQLLEEMRQQSLAFRIFSKEELERATNRFDKNRILGQGGYGTVYKGDMGGNQFVAIKQPKVINERQKKEFGKEMLILSQVNHRNIVKLLGCCLEVEVPMLVYEFVSNGNLFDLIHNENKLSLAKRLKIACDSADALAYLHFTASPPIIHGDVKSANILLHEDFLHEDFTAKVSDFGFSRLNPKDEDQFATLVQGTCGYLDPEYIQTCKLTEKSDVYSFGVVLLELLTRKKAIQFENGEQTTLASSFILAVKKEDRLKELLDNQVTSEEDVELIERIGELAVQCLSVRGEDRPTMKDVADQLNNMSKFKQHTWTPSNLEDIESFYPVPSDAQTSTSNTSIPEVPFPIECAR